MEAELLERREDFAFALNTESLFMLIAAVTAFIGQLLSMFIIGIW